MIDSSITELSFLQANDWFSRLPAERQIATLSPAYLLADAIRDTSLVPLFVGYQEGSEYWWHGVLKGRVEKAQCWDLQSAYGYGGPVTNSSNDGFLSRAWQKYAEWCRNHDILVEFIRLHPLASSWQVYGGQVVDDRQTVVIDLRDDFRAHYEVRSRTAVRKAEKSGLKVIIKAGLDIPGRFHAFYQEGMRQIGAIDFYLFERDYFDALSHMPSIRLFVIEEEGEWLSAGLFLQSGIHLEYHLSATTTRGRQLAATNLLLDACAQWGKEQGCHFLYLGGGTDKKPDNPLFFFKAGFSPLRLPYRYGFTIYQEERYRALQDSFRQAGNPKPYVMFYR